MSDGKELLVRRMAELRDAFKQNLGARLSDLTAAEQRVLRATDFAGAKEALSAIRTESHKLAGTAATFGFQELSDRARLLEEFARQRVLAGAALSDSDRLGLENLFRHLVHGGLGDDTRSIVEHTAWDFVQKAVHLKEPRSRTVVVVEDDAMVTQILASQLPHFGYHVEVIDNPMRLDDVVSRCDPAVVLMDIVFPDDRDAGITVVQDLRAEKTLTCPVVYMSVRSDLEARLGAVRSGCDGYLVKPVDLVELLDLLGRLTTPEVQEPYKVLIVDDDPQISGYYAGLLGQANVKTMAVNDPLQVMEPLREMQPDLVLMDIQMPGCTGFELAMAIRQDRNFVQMPIVFLSVSSMDEARLHSLRSGGDEYLTKSLSSEEFLTSVMARLRRARALKTTLDRLRLSENRFRAVAETANDAVITADDAGRIIFWNKAAMRIFGYESSEILGRSVIDLIPERHRKAVIDHVQSVLDGKTGGLSTTPQEIKVLCKDGTELPVEMSVGDWHAGDSHYFTGLLRNISARRDSEEQLRHAKEDAERANQAKTEFLSSMSHELRTPLNSILGFSQLLEADPLTPQQLDFVGNIRKSGDHLLKIIDEVLDLARIEAGKVEMTIEPIPVGQVVDECISMVDSLAKRYAVTVQAGKKAEFDALVDLTRFRQVVLNLLSNAIKYNRRDGTVIVHVEPATAPFMRLSVHDTGIGIEAHKHDQLFRPFSRLGAEATGIEGTGIGLNLTQRLVELMGGQIGFKSEFGRGSSFWVDIPLAGPDTFQASASTGKASALHDDQVTSDAEPRERMVLYVEDNAANVKLMQAVFKRLPGVSLMSAPTAEQGVELAAQHLPDLILMDINLPGMSGIEALACLREKDRTKNIPVVALSAAAMPDDIARVQEAGFNSYLTKPIDVGKTLTALREALEQD